MPTIQTKLPSASHITETVRRAITEDVGSGDLTAQLIDPAVQIKADLICREVAILCGVPWFEEAFNQIDPKIKIIWYQGEGDLLAAGERVCTLSGNARSILSVERVAINFLQTMSGTASTTRRYVRIIDTNNCCILDTRKTIPGLRIEQKYAVVIGGGQNHRIGLFDGILIKENHIKSAGSIKLALVQAQAVSPQYQLIEIEVESIAQLHEAMNCGATRILLDNFTIKMIKQAVQQAAGKVELEVSGDVSLENICAIAATGVDYISIGALTKHLKAVDYSLIF